MVLVEITSVIVTVSVVVKLLVWTAAVIDIVVVVGVLVIGVCIEVKLIVVGVIVIFLKCALPVSYSVDAITSNVDVDFFVDLLTDIMLVVLPGIGVEVLADVNANAFTVVTVLEFPVSTPLEGFSR